MRARGCLIALGAMVSLLLLCCVVGWFFGLPRFRDAIADDLADGLSTEVANVLSDSPGGVQPGTHTLSFAELQRQLDTNVGTSGVDDFVLSMDQGVMTIGFTSGTQEFGYTGTPVARDGRLVMENMKVSDNYLGWVMPADRLGRVIEDGINRYFQGQGLRIDSLQPGDDAITFTVSPSRE